MSSPVICDSLLFYYRETTAGVKVQRDRLAVIDKGLRVMAALSLQFISWRLSNWAWKKSNDFGKSEEILMEITLLSLCHRQTLRWLSVVSHVGYKSIHLIECTGIHAVVHASPSERPFLNSKTTMSWCIASSLSHLSCYLSSFARFIFIFK